MDAIATEIAGSARDQASSLREVSVAADQMDKVTQQNAAMVEETTAAAQSLSDETANLQDLIEHFRTSRGSASPAPLRGPAARPKASATARSTPQMRPTSQTKRAPSNAADDWQDF